jgi:hypothetical protein
VGSTTVDRAWVLNLDADRELARPDRFHRRGNDIKRAEAMIPALAELLEGAHVIRERDPDGAAAGMRGFAWCPTPSALAAIARSGAGLPPAPSLEVLRHVNHRAFSAGLGPTLVGGRFVQELDDVLQLVDQPTPSGSWLLKLPFSFAGAGRLPIFVGRVTDGERNWMQQSLAKGGLQVEPLVERLADFSQHGMISEDGSVGVGAPVAQDVSPGGVWQRSVRASAEALEDAEREALSLDTHRVAEALVAAGYFGPFGIDAYRYRWDDEVRFNPRCEINARYTMSWAIGMR